MSTQATPMNVVQALSPQLGQLLPVVNVHWADIKEERSFQTTLDGGMRTFYHIRGVKSHKDKPSIWIVTDGLEKTYMGEKRWGRSYDASTAPKIANDLVKCGTGGLAADETTILPAVWISRAADCPKTVIGNLTLPDDWEKQFPAFAAEVVLYRQREWEWCRNMVDAGDALHARGLTAEIYDKHRKSALWIEANQEDHLWINQTVLGTKKTCQFCATAIPANALRCPNAACGEILEPAKYEAAKKALAGTAKAEPISVK